MSGKGKRNSAASTYSSSKRRRERDLSPSSDDKQESAAGASPRPKFKKPSEKSNKQANGSKPSKDASDESSGDDDVERDPGVFEVAKIKTHRKRKGVIEYRVGWKGYESDDDSWEPADHLVDGALEILKQYRAAHNLEPITKSGRTSDASAKSKRSAKAVDSDESDADDDKKNRKRKRLSRDKPSSSIAPLRKNGTGGPTKADRDSVKNRKPRSESEASDSESVTDEQWHERHKKLPNWEALIRSVRTIEKPTAEDDDASQSTREKPDSTINVCLLWENGRVSWVSNKIARDKLPQKMLDFYEDHLQFSSTEP